MGNQPFVFIFFVAVILGTGFFTSCFCREPRQEGPLRCYVCNSAFHPDCGNYPVPNKYLVTCTPQSASALEPPTNEHTSRREVNFSVPQNTDFTVCRKITSTIPQQDNGNESKAMHTRILRNCGYLNKEQDNCKWGASHGIQNYMCQCGSSACNSGTVTRWSILGVFIPVVTAILLKN